MLASSPLLWPLGPLHLSFVPYGPNLWLRLWVANARFFSPCRHTCDDWLFYIRFHKQGQLIAWNEETFL